MKYRFITIIHNLELENIKNKGKKIFDLGRISNGNEVLDETIYIEPLKHTMGVHSCDEFKNKTYIYIDGELDGIKKKDEMDTIGVDFTFYYLRLVQSFTYELWNIKDNNIYVRDGFLLAYDKRFEDGYTYKASLSEVFSYSTLEEKISKFTDDEIDSASSKFEFSSYDEQFDYKNPVPDVFLKSKGSERLNRALYFTMGARGRPILPMKIVFYTSALECLFTVGNQEISHKISERVAILLGDNSKSKKELFNTVKIAYSYRSKLVHGQYIKGEDDDLVDVSQSLDSILRELFNNHNDIFKMKDDEMEEYFLNLIFY